MALSISQAVAESYPAVLNEKRKPANQWAENAAMREFERQGFIDKKSLGEHIEMTLDYQANTEGDFNTDDMGIVSDVSVKTEVLTAATYDIAELTEPVKWSKKDEVQNPSENQKVALVASLLANAIDAHDDKIEQKLFRGTYNGFTGLRTVVPVSGQGTVGGINAATESFWRNYVGTYTGDSDIESAMTIAWNRAAKGSGSQTMPTLLVADAETQALFEGTQQAFQRYVDTQELKAGFKILAFKTARFIYSQYADTRVYFLNPKSLKLVVSKEYFRDMEKPQIVPGRNVYEAKLYSALQLCTNNKSRLAVIHTASS